MVIIIAVLVVLALLVAAAWWIAQPKLDESARDLDAPLPLFSSRSTDAPARDAGQPRIEPAEVAQLRRAPAVPRQTVRRPESDNGAAIGDARRAAAPLTPTAPRDAVTPGVPYPPPPQHDVSRGGEVAEYVDATGAGAAGAEEAPATAAYAPPPPAGTVQFLPGRLEVLQGRDVAGQEVRFIRPDRSTERPEVTFGRAEGPLYRHVQLRAPTVSRRHARLTMDDSHSWMLENLSATNPVVLNGEEIAVGAPPRPLADGDRIEMGEVVFRFRTR